jgi:hypothetical protein
MEVNMSSAQGFSEEPITDAALLSYSAKSGDTHSSGRSEDWQYRITAALRSEFTKVFQQWMTRGFLVIVAVQLLTVTGVAFQLVCSAEALNWVALARMLQLSLGIFVGFFMICLGLFAAWMGLEGAFSASIRTSGAGASLTGATPGILLMVCGTLILAGCLFKPVKMSGAPDIDSPAANQPP